MIFNHFDVEHRKNMDTSESNPIVFIEKAPFANTEEEISTDFSILQESFVVEMQVEDEEQQEDETQPSVVDKSLENVNENTSTENEITEGETSAAISAIDGDVVTEPEEDSKSPNKIDGLTCKYCLKKFSSKSSKCRHLRVLHRQDIMNDPRPQSQCNRCVECKSTFKTVQYLRNHLSSEHGLSMAMQHLSFPNMNAFLKWKHDMERETLSSYTLRQGPRKVWKSQKSAYLCYRSGKFFPRVDLAKRQRMPRVAGSVKLGISCTAQIYVEELEDRVLVRFCPHHYGHGRDTNYVQLSEQEQVAIQESVSDGIPFETLLGDLRDSTSDRDTFQLHLLKKKDMRYIITAFNACDYVPRICDAESVEHWVRQCCQMEDSPILFYRPEEYGTEDSFQLIIMTEFQKHILLTCSHKIVCLDTLFRRKGARFYLSILFVMDEFDTAFPVAFCISTKIDKENAYQFLASVRESTGPLTCEFFMSDSEPHYYEAWKEIMDCNSRWLWSMWWMDHKVRTQMRCFKGNVSKRAETCKVVRMLMECQNQNVFHNMLKNFLDDLAREPRGRPMLKFFQDKYAETYEMWAYCYRKQLQLSINIHLEVMHRTFRYMCREGRKKRLDKFICVLMKLVRSKMLDRLSGSDPERLKLAEEAIGMCHASGMDIPTEHMTSLTERVWLVHADDEEGEVYVTREFESCPEHCVLRCNQCDVCVHMFSCSCIPSLINANMCQHIHAVVWKFVAPHFSPPNSPSPPDADCSDDFYSVTSASVAPPTTDGDYTNLVDNVLKTAHNVYNLVKDSKCTLSKDILSNILGKLNECMGVGSGKVALAAAAGKNALNSSTAVSQPYAPMFLSQNSASLTKPTIVFTTVPPSTLSQPLTTGKLSVSSAANQTPGNVLSSSVPMILPRGAPTIVKSNFSNLSGNIRPACSVLNFPKPSPTGGSSIPQYVILIDKTLQSNIQKK